MTTQRSRLWLIYLGLGAVLLVGAAGLVFTWPGGLVGVLAALPVTTTGGALVVGAGLARGPASGARLERRHPWPTERN